jgi:hypothetical protein
VSWIDVIGLTMDRAVVSRKAKLCDLVNEFFFCGKCHTLFHCTCLQIAGILKKANTAWKESHIDFPFSFRAFRYKWATFVTNCQVRSFGNFDSSVRLKSEGSAWADSLFYSHSGNITSLLSKRPKNCRWLPEFNVFKFYATQFVLHDEFVSLCLTKNENKTNLRRTNLDTVGTARVMHKTRLLEEEEKLGAPKVVKNLTSFFALCKLECGLCTKSKKLHCNIYMYISHICMYVCIYIYN